MNDIFFVILRRLRQQLIVLIMAYALSVWGLVMMPGPVVDGQTTHLSFFHALYVISYTATTIGFGEVPHEFSDAQRAWMIVSIYLSVIAWAYVLACSFHLSRDLTIRGAIARRRFAKRVASLTDPFVLIVGYGQSGIMLARMLDRMGKRLVIVESRPERAAQVEIDEFDYRPLFLAADGRLPDILIDAGVTHRRCTALVALAGNDDSNQSVAIGGVALNPSIRVIARVHTPIAQANLTPFKKIEQINPYAIFANNIALDLGSPEKLRVIEWLSGLPGSIRPESLKLPKGHWVVCGTGSFAQYAVSALETSGASCQRVTVDPVSQGDSTTALYHGDVLDDLLLAGIERAVGLIACSESDAINLAIITRARSANANLCVLVRQVNAVNASLIDASQAYLRLSKAEVVSHKARQLLTSPLLIRFLKFLDEDGGDLAQRTGELLEQKIGEKVPFMWVFNCFTSYPGMREALTPDIDPPLSINDLLTNPETPSERMGAIPLLLLRKKEEIPLPPEETRILPGDRILFAGQRNVEDLQRRFLLEPSPLTFVRTGIEPPRSWLFRHLAARKRKTGGRRAREASLS